jgi:hypothetical protein
MEVNMTTLKNITELPDIIKLKKSLFTAQLIPAEDEKVPENILEQAQITCVGATLSSNKDSRFLNLFFIEVDDDIFLQQELINRSFYTIMVAHFKPNGDTARLWRVNSCIYHGIEMQWDAAEGKPSKYKVIYKPSTIECIYYSEGEPRKIVNL